jgi:hypothetical protein
MKILSKFTAFSMKSFSQKMKAVLYTDAVSSKNDICYIFTINT